LIKDLKLRGTP
jgi:protease II